MSNFWRSQPVDRGSSEGIINHSKKIEKDPIPLPNDFTWGVVNDIPTIIEFLENFYVEDTSSSYRLSYTPSFFEYLFGYPSHKEEYSLGLFYKNKIVGYVLAREHLMSLRNEIYKIVSVNFLCLDKNLRNKSLAPLMIKEITRIANLNGIFQAIFTAEKDHGFSISTAQYFHYPLHEDTLIGGGVIDNPDCIKPVPYCREDSKLIQDPSLIADIYSKINENTTLFESFDEASFNQLFAGKQDVFHVVYNDKTKEFASFYIVYTKCLLKNIILKKAYLFYWYGSVDIITDAIAIAHNSLNIDMFDVLDILNNRTIIKKLELAEGTGYLKYHVFNIKEKQLPSESINFILF